MLSAACTSNRETRVNLPNYYEFLQISPNAEAETIHRVYRFLAVRFHPDNPESGDPDKFHLLQQAYEVLSNPETRAAYDTSRAANGGDTPPYSDSVDFMDSTSGELNRRLAVLALLYIRRRTYPDSPAVSLFEIEARMGFPRDYLEFTLWYLQKKGYISRADNADFVLLADGVDFVESQRHGFPVLNRLLTSGSGVNGSNSTSRPRSTAAGNIFYPGQERRKGDRRGRPQ